MTKNHQWFYGADIIIVLSKDAQTPISPTVLKKRIEAFEQVLYSFTAQENENNRGIEEELIKVMGVSDDPPPLPGPVDPPSDSKYTTNGWIYGGCSFEKRLLLQNDTYKKLGLLIEKELNEVRGKVTIRRYRTFAAAASLEVLSSISFKLIPSDKEKIDPKYGMSYPTYLPYSSRNTFAEMRSVVEGLEFNIGTAEAPINYKVDPDSIRPRRLKTFIPL